MMMTTNEEYTKSQIRRINNDKNLDFSLQRLIGQPSNETINSQVFGHESIYALLEDRREETEQSIHDHALIDRLTLIIKNYLLSCSLDFTNYYTTIDSYREAYNKLQITDFEIKDIIRNHLHRDIFQRCMEMIMFREMSILAYKNEQFGISFNFNAISHSILGEVTTNSNSLSEYFENEISKRNRQKSLDYWTPKKKEKEERKVKYLRIMKEREFSKYTDAAEYIHANENSEKRGYRQIYDELREADNEK